MARSLVFAFLVAVTACMPTRGDAQPTDFPSRPITLIVPFAAGGNVDVAARLIAEPMSRALGQQIVIENISGAGGTTAVTRAARAEPNGYTIVLGHMGTHAASVGLYPKLAYDPVRDFAPIGYVTGTPILVLARKDFPAATLAEFISVLRANPGKFNQAHGGVGSIGHTTCLLFASVAGFTQQGVTYRGSGPALNDLIAGSVDFACDQVLQAGQQVRAGTIKGFAVATPERNPTLPDLPTTAEAGLPGFQASGWSALFAPANTPAPVLARLEAALAVALDDADVRSRFEAMGADLPKPAERGPVALARFLGAEIAKWTPILTAVTAK